MNLIFKNKGAILRKGVGNFRITLVELLKLKDNQMGDLYIATILLTVATYFKLKINISVCTFLSS